VDFRSIKQWAWGKWGKILFYQCLSEANSQIWFDTILNPHFPQVSFFSILSTIKRMICAPSLMGEIVGIFTGMGIPHPPKNGFLIAQIPQKWWKGFPHPRRFPHGFPHSKKKGQALCLTLLIAV